MRNYCLMNTVSVCDDEKVLEMGSGNGCTALRMYLMPRILHLKMAKMINFVLCIFITIKNVDD